MTHEDAKQWILDALADLPSGPPGEEMLAVLLAEAWDEGFKKGHARGKWEAEVVRDEPLRANPYRKDAR